MLGRIQWTQERSVQVKREVIAGLPVLTLSLPVSRWETERKMRKGARILVQQGVVRVLTPAEFPWWPILIEQGLRPVSTRALRCALASTWVRRMLDKKGVSRTRAAVVLKGEQETPEMAWIARDLCAVVRNLAFEVPGGESLAAKLRREYGLPVLPVQIIAADVTLCFEDGPLLTDAKYKVSAVSLPLDCDILPLLSALWESGMIKTEDIVLEI